MAQFSMFVYALINFLSLFLVESAISMLFFTPIFNSKVFLPIIFYHLLVTFFFFLYVMCS